MRAKRKQWLRVLMYCTLVFACAAAADLISFSSLGLWGELRTYDLRFKLRGPLPESIAAPITILAIDEEALSRIPDPMMLWDRHYARVIEALVAQGAGVIGIDFIFADIGHFDPEGQRALGESLLLAGTAGVPVILAYRVHASGVEQPPQTVRMTALAAGHTLAYANLTTDSDDFVRRQQIFAIGEDRQQDPGFALAIVDRFAKKYQRSFAPPEPASHTLLINYRGPGQFRQISFAKALEAAKKEDAAFLRNNFRDRIVLIGRVGGPGDEDLHSTPQYFWGERFRKTGSVRTPGVEIHASAITTLLEKNDLKPLTPARQRAALFFLILLAALICYRFSPTLSPLLSALAITGYILLSYLCFVRGWWLPVISPVAGALLVVAAAEIADFILEGREKRRLRDLFSRYVDNHVIERILQSPEAFALHGERKQVAILFADIRNFTTRSEAAPAVAVVQELNEYFTEMVAVIQENRGMVDKFLGDGIMGIFGAPIEDSDAAFHSVQAALGMTAALEKLNERFVARGTQPLSIGIGIHTGEAVIGNIGSPAKMEYTAIGDAVNVASRIEGLTRTLDAPILISGETFNALQGRIPANLMGTEHVKGRTQSVPVYAVAVMEINGLSQKPVRE